MSPTETAHSSDSGIRATISTRASAGMTRATTAPFGTGLRACIGRQFALHEATLVLGLLLRRYDLHPDPDYRLRVTERLTLMPDGLRLRPERRTAPAVPRARDGAGAPSDGRCPVRGTGE